MTNYLKRKINNKLHIHKPPNLYLSFNNRYNSNNEKGEFQNNINKFKKLRANIRRSPDKKLKLITEFMKNNGINQEKYFKINNLIKFESYLYRPIKINPKFSISKIIKNLLINKRDNKLSSNKEKENDEIIENDRSLVYLYTPLSARLTIKKIKNKNNNNNIKSFSLRHKEQIPDLFLSLNNTKNENKNNYIFKKNNLKILVKNLELELKQIKNEKLNNFENNNKFIIKNNYSMKSFKDNNKYVPNFCLSSKELSERYKYNINKYNNRIKNIFKRQEHIKNINNRLYYSMKKKNIKDFDLTDIKKNLKLTEYIIMKRGKEKLFKQDFEEELINDKGKNIII